MASPTTAPYAEPSRAEIALAFAVLGLALFGPLGLVGWFLARTELGGIRSGRRDPKFEGIARAARLVGVIAIAVWVLKAAGWAAIILTRLGG